MDPRKASINKFRHNLLKDLSKKINVENVDSSQKLTLFKESDPKYDKLKIVRSKKKMKPYSLCA